MSRGNPMDLNDDADGLTSLISDVEEEGELDETGLEHESKDTLEETLEQQIADGSDDIYASSETVAAMAIYLEIVDPIVRHHETAGTRYFHKRRSADDETEDQPENSLLADLLEDPAAALSATRPRGNRSAIFSLLA